MEKNKLIDSLQDINGSGNGYAGEVLMDPDYVPGNPIGEASSATRGRVIKQSSYAQKNRNSNVSDSVGKKVVRQSADMPTSVAKFMESAVDDETTIRERIESKRQITKEHDQMIADLAEELKELIRSGVPEKEANEMIRKKQKDILNTKYPVPQKQLDMEKKVSEMVSDDNEDYARSAKKMDELSKKLRSIKENVGIQSESEEDEDGDRDGDDDLIADAQRLVKDPIPVAFHRVN
jgi:hypothetical protein